MGKVNAKKSDLGCQWIIAVLVGILGVIFLIWLINRDPEKEKEEKELREAYVIAKQTERDSIREQSYADINLNLKQDIMSELKVAEIPCYDVRVAESGCVWVYTADNGKNRDGLASTLCSTIKKHHHSCVTIVDRNQNSLGKAYCR